MKALPVIVGFGGVNAAGRTSFNHSYCRTVFESLPSKLQKSTIGSLSSLMGLAALKSDGNFYDHKQQAISAQMSWWPGWPSRSWPVVEMATLAITRSGVAFMMPT